MGKTRTERGAACRVASREGETPVWLAVVARWAAWPRVFGGSRHSKAKFAVAAEPLVEAFSRGGSQRRWSCAGSDGFGEPGAASPPRGAGRSSAPVRGCRRTMLWRLPNPPQPVLERRTAPVGDGDGRVWGTATFRGSERVSPPLHPLFFLVLLFPSRPRRRRTASAKCWPSTRRMSTSWKTTRSSLLT